MSSLTPRKRKPKPQADPEMPGNEIVVASDQHLGYENSDKEAFNRFLDDLQNDSRVADLVLLGDVVDMWRRDASGVFLEARDTIDRVISLAKRIRVHYVAGNHDYHVLQLRKHSYPFDFVRDLTLEQGGKKYRFVHGYEFDALQTEAFMEALCRVMSDEVGDFESGIWATITRDWSDLRYFFTALFRKGEIRKTAEALRERPETRLKATLGEVERRARSSVREGEVLVFGHTHRPFITKEENLVNCGSWVKDAPVHNTFVRIKEGKPRLFVFGGEEILERAETLQPKLT